MNRMLNAALFVGGIALLAVVALAGAADERLSAIRQRRRYVVTLLPLNIADEDDAISWFSERGIERFQLWLAPDGSVRGSGLVEIKHRRWWS